MKIYDLYGIQATTLDSARELVEQVLGNKMMLHESDYWGIYFLFGVSGGRTF